MKELQQEISSIIEVGRELIAKAEDIESWSKDDDKQLKVLKEIVALMVKIQPLAAEEVEEIDPEKDKNILQRFLERNKQ